MSGKNAKKARKEAYKQRRAERQERFRQTQGYQNMQDRYESGEESYKNEQYDSSVADYDNDGRVSNEEHARYMRSMRGTINPGRRSMADRISRGSYVDPNDIGHQHKYATGLDDWTARERKAIASGSNLTSTIPKFAMRGLSESTHEGRMRVRKINAYKNIYNYDLFKIIKLLEKNKAMLKLVQKYVKKGYKSMYRWGKWNLKMVKNFG